MESIRCTQMSMAQSTPKKIMVLPLKNFMKILNLHPQTNPYIVFFLTLPLKKFLGFCYLPLKNSICFQQGAEGMDIKITIMPNDSTVMINSTLEIDLRLDYQTQGHLSPHH